MNFLTKGLAGGAAAMLLAVPSFAGTIRINEIRIDQFGDDNDEYFELLGPPNASLDGLTYIVIGDSSAGGLSGVIEAIVDLTGSSISASGFFVAAESTFTLSTPDLVTTLNFENSDNVTHMLVEGFKGLLGDDLDTDDNCTLDTTPWTSIVDSIALVENENPPAGKEDECHYGPPSIGPEGIFVPAHVYRCGPKDWRIGAIDPVPAQDTPGAENTPCTQVCGLPGAGNCFEENESPGCDDEACCETVCAVSPECCDIVWDALCAEDAAALCLTGGKAPNVLINEIRIDQPSTDNDEYFELKGDPGASLDGVYYVVIGDGSNASGQVEAAIDLSGNVMPADGLFVVAESSFSLGVADLTTTLPFENSDNVTHMLLFNFTASVGDDLDTEDDCVLDSSPWETEMDRIAVVEEENPAIGTECHYGPPSIGPDGVFAPAHIFRSGTPGPVVWCIGAFDPLDGTDTPGVENPECDLPPACEADLDGDGVVGAGDLAILLGSWGPVGGGCVIFVGFPGDADFNDDCDVGAADLPVLLGAWGPCP